MSVVVNAVVDDLLIVRDVWGDAGTDTAPRGLFLSCINGVYRALKHVKYYIQVVQNILRAYVISMIFI